LEEQAEAPPAADDGTPGQQATGQMAKADSGGEFADIFLGVGDLPTLREIIDAAMPDANSGGGTGDRRYEEAQEACGAPPMSGMDRSGGQAVSPEAPLCAAPSGSSAEERAAGSAARGPAGEVAPSAGDDCGEDAPAAGTGSGEPADHEDVNADRSSLRPSDRGQPLPEAPDGTVVRQTRPPSPAEMGAGPEVSLQETTAGKPPRGSPEPPPATLGGKDAEDQAGSVPTNTSGSGAAYSAPGAGAVLLEDLSARPEQPSPPPREPSERVSVASGDSAAAAAADPEEGVKLQGDAPAGSSAPAAMERSGAGSRLTHRVHSAVGLAGASDTGGIISQDETEPQSNSFGLSGGRPAEIGPSRRAGSAKRSTSWRHAVDEPARRLERAEPRQATSEPAAPGSALGAAEADSQQRRALKAAADAEEDEPSAAVGSRQGGGPDGSRPSAPAAGPDPVSTSGPRSPRRVARTAATRMTLAPGSRWYRLGRGWKPCAALRLAKHGEKRGAHGRAPCESCGDPSSRISAGQHGGSTTPPGRLSEAGGAMGSSNSAGGSPDGQGPVSCAAAWDSGPAGGDAAAGGRRGVNWVTLEGQGRSWTRVGRAWWPRPVKRRKLG